MHRMFTLGAYFISDVSMWELLYVHHDCEASVDLSTPLSSWNEPPLSHTHALRSPRALLPPAIERRVPLDLALCFTISRNHHMFGSLVSLFGILPSKRTTIDP